VRSVFVTQYVPFPADFGAKKRALAILERLAREGSTTVVAFDDGTADAAALAQRGVTVKAIPEPPGRLTRLIGAVRTGSVYAGRSWSPAFRELVQACAGRDLDLLLIESIQMAPYASGAEARLRLLDMQNVESALALGHGATQGPLRRPAYRLESLALRRWEKRVGRTFDAVSVVSERDRDRLPAGPSPVLVCPNGWDTMPLLPPSEEPVAAFVALLSWAPNVEAVRWLGTEVWPRVRAAVPDARLLLVGRDPAASVRAFAGDGVEVSGTVVDVRPWLARSLVGLAPLRSGGGSRLKILESLDAGRPVVATSIGAEGLEDLVGKGVVVADEAEPFAAEIVALLDDPAGARALGQQGHRAVEARFGWDLTLAPLFDWIDARSA
jgi:glycosyltransferase involved in cell wall biosynthesis